QIPPVVIVVQAGQRDAVPVEIAVPEIVAPPSPTISSVAANTELNLPRGLISFLERRSIKTLADIRREGGLSHIEGLPGRDNSAVSRLESHAYLNQISDNVPFNAKLIDAGFGSVGEIATASRSEFVSKFGPEFGDFKVAR